MKKGSTGFSKRVASGTQGTSECNSSSSTTQWTQLEF